MKFYSTSRCGIYFSRLRKILFLQFWIGLILVCSSCAGIGIIASSDPKVKLNDAASLLYEQDRPLPAQRLIFEAIAIYKTSGDEHGLGLAYKNYADLLHSTSIVSGRESKLFRESTSEKTYFFDKSITFDNRLQKSSEYYSMAIEHLKNSESTLIQKNQYDALTNVNFNIAISYHALSGNEQTCLFFDKALNAYSENIKLHPDAMPYSPKGSITEYLASLRKQSGCL